MGKGIMTATEAMMIDRNWYHQTEQDRALHENFTRALEASTHMKGDERDRFVAKAMEVFRARHNEIRRAPLHAQLGPRDVGVLAQRVVYSIDTRYAVRTEQALENNSLRIYLSREIVLSHETPPRRFEQVTQISDLDVQAMRSDGITQVVTNMMQSLQRVIAQDMEPTKDVAALLAVAGFAATFEDHDPPKFVLRDASATPDIDPYTLSPSHEEFVQDAGATFEEWQRLVSELVRMREMRKEYPHLSIYHPRQRVEPTPYHPAAMHKKYVQQAFGSNATAFGNSPYAPSTVGNLAIANASGKTP